MNELIPVNIVIADRTYRLKINPTDEEHIRANVQLINEKIREFKINFAGKDIQDYISMVLLWFATENTNTSANSIVVKDTSQKLSALEKQIDSMLKD